MRRAAIERTYIPKFFNNRNLEEDERVTVDLSVATIEEKENFSKMVYVKGGKMEQKKNFSFAIRKKVKKIHNYFDESGNPIDTAEKLINDAVAGSEESISLYEELWNKIMGYDRAAEDVGEDPDELPEEIPEVDSESEEMTPGE